MNGLLSAYEYETVKQKFEQPFSEISDLIDEYNFHGFHDVCNVLARSNVTHFHHLPPGFEEKNATGKF